MPADAPRHDPVLDQQAPGRGIISQQFGEFRYLRTGQVVIFELHQEDLQRGYYDTKAEGNQVASGGEAGIICLCCAEKGDLELSVEHKVFIFADCF